MVNVRPTRSSNIGNRYVLPNAHYELEEEELESKLQAHINRYITKMVFIIMNQVYEGWIYEKPLRYTSPEYLINLRQTLTQTILQIKKTIYNKIKGECEQNNGNSKIVTYEDLYEQYRLKFTNGKISKEQIEIAYLMRYLWCGISLKEIINKIINGEVKYTEYTTLSQMFGYIRSRKIPQSLSNEITQLLTYLSGQI